MSNPPPLSRIRNPKDEDHLRLLSIFYFVAAGFSLISIGLHYAQLHALNSFASNPQFWPAPPQQQPTPGYPPPGFPPPQMCLAIFKSVYWYGVVMSVICAIADVCVGFFVRARKRRVLSIVIGVVNLIRFPIGTAVGISTLIVLTRPSVTEIFENNTTGAETQ